MSKILYEKKELTPADLEKSVERRLINQVIEVEGKTFKVQFQSILNGKKESHYFFWNDQQKVYVEAMDALDLNCGFDARGQHQPREDRVIFSFEYEGERFVIASYSANTFKTYNTEDTEQFDFALESKIKRIVPEIIQEPKKEVYDVTMDFLLHPWQFLTSDEHGRPLETPIKFPDQVILKIEDQRSKKIKKGKEEKEKKAEQRSKDMGKRFQKLQKLKIS